jgi:beta-1,4-N-acetylglucosaminyltransferase
VSTLAGLNFLRRMPGPTDRLSKDSHATGSSRTTRVDLLLVCSAGGHLLQLQLLRAAWEPHTRLWVTHDKEDARSLLTTERVVYAYAPTTRSLPNLLRNLGLAALLVWQARPRVVLTTGAGIAVPFAWIARALGARVIYVESLTRIEGPSLSCRLIAPVADSVYVQWPELVAALPRARFAGNVLPVR